MYKKSNNLLFLHKKTEKLSRAVYLITDFFDDKESLKWELRKKSVELLSFINKVSSRGRLHAGGETISALVNELVVLLCFCRNVHLISAMNFAVLREEYIFLLELFSEHIAEEKKGENFEFPERFFSESVSSHPMSSIVDDDEEMRKKSFKNRDFFNTPLSSQKKIRRENILKILRLKGAANIKEIARRVDGISEKTLQRELGALISEGIVLKRGERRWSTYALKE